MVNVATRVAKFATHHNYRSMQKMSNFERINDNESGFPLFLPPPLRIAPSAPQQLECIGDSCQLHFHRGVMGAS